MNLLERRRAMMSRKAPAEEWTYILKADATGRVEKAKIPVTTGQHVHMEWDTSRLSENANSNCIISFYRQVDSFTELNMTPYRASSYPILWNNQEIMAVFRGGYVDLDIPKNLNMFVGYWRDSDTTNRRLVGKYIKIRIT